jgi:hypothetical protein
MKNTHSPIAFFALLVGFLLLLSKVSWLLVPGVLLIIGGMFAPLYEDQLQKEFLRIKTGQRGQKTPKGEEAVIHKVSNLISAYPNLHLVKMRNDNDESIQYMGNGWKHEHVASSQYYQGDVTATENANDYFEYRFTGSGIDCFVGSRPDKSGLVEIYLDGESHGIHGTPTSPDHMLKPFFHKTGLERGIEHTIKMILQSGYLAIDAIGDYV